MRTTGARVIILVAGILVLMFGNSSQGHYISAAILVCLIVAFLGTKKPKPKG
jgi:hypothetical protein